MENDDNIENSADNRTDSNVNSEIFADEIGKMVFDAFEKLGTELNNLTENLEAQFEDVNENDTDSPAYENINVRGIISASMEDRNTAPDKESADVVGNDNDNNGDEDLADLLNNSTGEASTTSLFGSPYLSYPYFAFICR